MAHRIGSVPVPPVLHPAGAHLHLHVALGRWTCADVLHCLFCKIDCKICAILKAWGVRRPMRLGGGDDPWEEVRDPICSRMCPIFLGQWQILHPKLYQDTPLHWMISTMQWRAVEAKFIFSEKSNEIGCWYVAPRSNLVNLGQGIDLKLYLDTATTWRYLWSGRGSSFHYIWFLFYSGWPIWATWSTICKVSGVALNILN